MISFIGGAVVETSLEAWQRVQDVNLRSVFLCCKHGIPHLLDAGGGSVINIASFVAVMGAAVSQISYTASKGAVLSMSRELGVEFAAAACGSTRSARAPSTRRCCASSSPSDPRRRPRRLVHIPMGRFAEAREIAKAALFLASDESSLRHREHLHGRRRDLRRVHHARVAAVLEEAAAERAARARSMLRSSASVRSRSASASIPAAARVGVVCR